MVTSHIGVLFVKTLTESYRVSSETQSRIVSMENILKVTRVMDVYSRGARTALRSDKGDQSLYGYIFRIFHV